MQNQNQPPKFEQSPDAQEYIQKLQQGRTKLPDDASPLERRAFQNLGELSKRMRELTTAQSDNEKQIAALQQR